MIYVLNIVTATKESDALYNEVAVNTFPIVWTTDSQDIEELFADEEFKTAMEKIIKSKKVYENAIIYYRSFDDEMILVKSDKFRFKDKINIEI